MHLTSLTNNSPGQNASSSDCISRYERFNPTNGGNRQILINEAAKVDAYRQENPERYVYSILQNMGFREAKAKKLFEILHPYFSGEKNIQTIPRTSALGRMLTEFGHRQKAFEAIHRHRRSVSEIVLDDIARPLSPELRKSAEREAFALSNPSRERESGLFCSLGIQVSSFFHYIYSKMPSLPVVAAESIPDPCEQDLLSDACFKGLSSEKTEELKRVVNEQVEKTAGKNCIRLLGYSGAGKGSFINYLFSESCKTNVITGVKCTSEIAETGGGNKAVTKHIKAHPADPFSGFIGDTVIVDFPGFLGRGSHSLTNLLESMFSTKSMIEVGTVARSFIDIILIEYDTILSSHGALTDLISVLELNKERPNSLVIITKVPRPLSTEGTKTDVLPNKESLIQALKDSKFHSTLADSLLLYDVSDTDLALSCSTNSGGGTKKAQLISLVADLQKKEMDRRKNPNAQQISHESLITRQILESFEQIQEKLESALKTDHKEKAKKTLDRIDKIIKITNFGPLIEKVERTIEGVNWVGMEIESGTKFRTMLETGITDPFLQHLQAVLIPPENSALTQGRLNKTNLINAYVHSILDATQIHWSLQGSPAFKQMDQHFSLFTKTLEKEFREKVDLILSELKKATLECGYIDVDKESNRWRNSTDILGLNITEAVFNEIDVLSKRLKRIQEEFPSKREEIFTDRLLSYRNKAFLSLVGLAILYRAFGKTILGILFRRRRNERNILSGQIAGVPIYFTKGRLAGPGQYNEWEVGVDGTLELGGQLNGQARHVLILNGRRYWLQPVNMIEQFDRRIEQMEANIREIISAAPLRTSEIALIGTTITSAITAAFMAINSSVATQLAFAGSFYYLQGQFKEFSIDTLKSLGVGDYLEQNWGRQIDSQACNEILTRLGAF